MHRSFRCYILSCCWKVDFSTVWDFPTFPDFPTETDNFPPRHPNPPYTHKVALWNRISRTCDLINCTRINQVPVLHSKGSSCSLLEFYAPHTSSMHPTLAHLKPHLQPIVWWINHVESTWPWSLYPPDSPPQESADTSIVLLWGHTCSCRTKYF